MPVPFHLFISVDGSCGNSHLMNTISRSVSKLLLYQSESLDKPRGLAFAPTGVAAININGTIIHSDLDIPCRGKLMPLSDMNRAELRSSTCYN